MSETRKSNKNTGMMPAFFKTCRWSWLVIGIAVVLCGFCIVQLFTPLKKYVYEGASDFDESMEASDYVVYQQIPLPPGVYEVILEYESDRDVASLCIVEDGTVFTGGLLTNGEHFYKGLKQTGYYIWLFEATDALQVIVRYGSGTLRTGNLVLQETNQLWSML